MIVRGGSRAAATSKMECFVIVIIVNGFQPLTIITKHSILDVAALDPLLIVKYYASKFTGFTVSFKTFLLIPQFNVICNSVKKICLKRMSFRSSNLTFASCK